MDPFSRVLEKTPHQRPNTTPRFLISVHLWLKCVMLVKKLQNRMIVCVFLQLDTLQLKYFFGKLVLSRPLLVQTDSQ